MHEENSESKNLLLPRQVFYLVLGFLVTGMIVHIEFGIAAKIAPEHVLIQVVDPDGYADENAECFADIVVGKSIGNKKKPLTRLGTVYDFIDPQVFFANTDRGFYLLETGLTGNEEEFEIRVVCYADGLEGVSYTIVNNENQKECQIQDSGKIVVC